MYTGFQEVASPPRMLNASQYAELNNDARRNAGESINPAFSDPSVLADSANWINEIFRTALMQNWSASIRGGTESLRYNLSGGLTRQDGVIISSAFERRSFRLNLDSDVSQWLDVGNSLTYSYSKFQNEGGGHLVGTAMNNLPTQPVARNGEFSGPEGIAEFAGDENNPVGLASINDHSDAKHRVLNNIFAEIRPVSGLRFRSEFGLDLAFERARNWSPRYQWGVKQNPESHLFESSFDRIDWLWDNTLTYDVNLDVHRFVLLTGISAQRSSSRFIGATGQSFVSDIANQLDNIQSNQSVLGSTTDFGLLSYMGRVNYDYQSRYLVTATARYDGSSRFGANYRYGFFPSASAAWRISQEPFMPEWRHLDDLKIRVGYGITGNQEAIPAFGYVALLNSTFRYTFGNTTVPAVVPENYPNQSLRWEQVVQSNIAMDLIMFDGRLEVTAEYYIRDTEDMLLTSPIPITSGYYDFGHPILNVGAIRNRGFEFSINTRNNLGSLNWISGFNISFNENEILRLSGADGDDPIPGGEVAFGRFATRLEVGRPVGSFYGFVTDGIFQNQDEVDAHAVQTPGSNPATSTAPGDIRFLDLNNDGVIDDDDRTYIGNPNPDFIFGWTNNFSYRNFDLSIFVQGVYGNDIFNVNRMRGEQMAVARNQWATTLDRWSGEGTSVTIPRPTTNDPNNNSRVSDRYIEDGSYLRIKNLTLGYSLPVSVLDRIGFRQIRVYGSVQNLYTLTNYTGFDPEVGLDGMDNSVYPQSRIITTGINIGF
jgi:TonB-linked SusC/RagA family outer membrane protein